MSLEGYKISFKFQNFNNMYFNGIRLYMLTKCWKDNNNMHHLRYWDLHGHCKMNLWWLDFNVLVIITLVKHCIIDFATLNYGIMLPLIKQNHYNLFKNLDFVKFLLEGRCLHTNVLQAKLLSVYFWIFEITTIIYVCCRKKKKKPAKVYSLSAVMSEVHGRCLETQHNWFLSSLWNSLFCNSKWMPDKNHCYSISEECSPIVS